MRKSTAFLIIALVAVLSVAPALRADTVSANTNFIDQAYADLLQRPPSPTDLALGLTALGSETRYQFALSLDTSAPYYSLLVKSYDQNLLGVTPTAVEIATLAALIGTGDSDEFIQALLVSTPEFFTNSGGTNAGFITALFKDFLNRTPTAGELAFWETELLTLTRNQVASMILASSEYDTDLVEGYYFQFLRRPADPTGLSLFATALNNGTLTDEQVIASLIGTDEYFNMAQTPEPATAALLGFGLAGLVLLRRQLC